MKTINTANIKINDKDARIVLNKEKAILEAYNKDDKRFLVCNVILDAENEHKAILKDEKGYFTVKISGEVEILNNLFNNRSKTRQLVSLTDEEFLSKKRKNEIGERFILDNKYVAYKY